MSENQNCIICLEQLKQPKQCNGCKNYFCTQCVLQWKFKQNTCPLRCKISWDIDLSDVDEDKNEGFVICPLDQKVGSLRCITCKQKFIFNQYKITEKYCCKQCNRRLIYYESSQLYHQNCEYLKLIYFHCESCDIKMCDCILKSGS